MNRTTKNILPYPFNSCEINCGNSPSDFNFDFVVLYGRTSFSSNSSFCLVCGDRLYEEPKIQIFHAKLPIDSSNYIPDDIRRCNLFCFDCILGVVKSDEFEEEYGILSKPIRNYYERVITEMKLVNS